MLLPITGPAYTHASQDVNAQKCINLFPTEIGPDGLGIDDPNNRVDQEGVSKGALIRTPGHKLLIDLNGAACRGIVTINSTDVYTVIDSSVYKLTINQQSLTATSTLLGTIGTTTGPVRMRNNLTQLIIVDGSSAGYIYTFASGIFAQISDPDFLGGSSVVYNDGYFLYNQPGTPYVWNSNQADGTTWSAVQFFTAESKPCIVVGLAVNKGEIWVFADSLVEVWYDAANPPPGTPYSYRIGSGMDIGCSAPNSIVEMETINVWLDSRGFVCQSDISPYIRNNNSGYDLRVISTPALHAEWQTYPTLSDATATFYTDRGHIIYMITFPSAGKTWCYDFPTKPMRAGGSVGSWHQRTYLNPVTSLEEQCLSQYVTKLGQLNISGGLRSGKIYVMSANYYDDDGVPIKCTRATAPFTSDFKTVAVDKLELRMQTGYAVQTGDGANPQVVLRYSNDGAHTWSDPIQRPIGLVGQYNNRITWNRLGSSWEWVFEFSITSPINFSLIKANAAVTAVEDS